MKIKVKLRGDYNHQSEARFIQFKNDVELSKGEWIDLRTFEDDCMIKRNELHIIDLGIAMQLPEGFEAHIVPRSSTLKNFNILSGNSIGIIDSSYRGNNDYWGFPAYAVKSTEIAYDNRICQFRIMPSQKATVWQKLKWLFTKKIQFEYVGHFKEAEDRGGFGSTGVE